MAIFITVLVILIIGTVAIINSIKGFKRANIKKEILQEQENERLKVEKEKLEEELEKTRQKKRKAQKWLWIFIAIVAAIVLFAVWM